MKSIILLVLFTVISFAEAQPSEQLKLPIPKDFKIGYEKYNLKGAVGFKEYVHKDESVQNWSHLITTNIFYRNIKPSAKQYSRIFLKNVKKSCPDAKLSIVKEQQENGYDMSLIMFHCPKSPLTQKVETTFMKSIKGRNSFYVIQKAYTRGYDKKMSQDMVDFFSHVYVCDKRLNNCPK